MKNTESAASQQREYERLRDRLGQLGPISQGSVQDRTARKGGGAGYQWTRKVAGKTLTVSFTQEQFDKMKDAISNYRRLRQHLRKMESPSRRMSFQACPQSSRRKDLSIKTLGIHE